MKYFRARENLKTDYSGYQEASSSLRNRLIIACRKYIARHIGGGQGGYWIPQGELEHELGINLEKTKISQIIDLESYDYVFEAIEIYLAVAKKYASMIYYDILENVQRAFKLSGSVYFVDKNGQINLKIDEKLAEDLKETKEILKDNQTAYKTFFDTVGNLMARKDTPENIIKDIFVALEDYLKKKTGKSSFSNAIAYLESEKIITGTQKALFDKIQAYRSDAYKVAHAGKSGKPVDLDAIWFLETVISQLKYVDRKLNQ